METKTNLAKAVLAVMKAVRNIEKDMSVGTGSNAYPGLSDKLVKDKIGDAMLENGLCILPIGVEARTQIDRWEETTNYNNVPTVKQKQSVLAEVTTKYLLLHESGESQELAGYGHGTDPQDKAAGKATTYAMKYTLLYTFMVAIGKIDDSDKEHSDEKETPAPKATTTTTDSDARPWLTEAVLNKAIERIKGGEKDVCDKTIAAFRMKKEYKTQLETAKAA